MFFSRSSKDHKTKQGFELDPKLMLRLDSNTYSHDAYGKCQTEKQLVGERQTALESLNHDGGEVTVRGPVPIQEYVTAIRVDTMHERDEIIGILKDAGITTLANGIPVEVAVTA